MTKTDIESLFLLSKLNLQNAAQYLHLLEATGCWHRSALSLPQHREVYIKAKMQPPSAQIDFQSVGQNVMWMWSGQVPIMQ